MHDAEKKATLATERQRLWSAFVEAREDFDDAKEAHEEARSEANRASTREANAKIKLEQAAAELSKIMETK